MMATVPNHFFLDLWLEKKQNNLSIPHLFHALLINKSMSEIVFFV